MSIQAAEPDPEIPLRTAGYARMSTDHLEQQTSIQGQIDALRQSIEENPRYALVDIYVDDGISGTKAENRPELQRLLNDCRTGLIDLIHYLPADAGSIFEGFLFRRKPRRRGEFRG